MGILQEYLWHSIVGAGDSYLTLDGLRTVYAGLKGKPARPILEWIHGIVVAPAFASARRVALVAITLFVVGVYGAALAVSMYVAPKSDVAISASLGEPPSVNYFFATNAAAEWREDIEAATAATLDAFGNGYAASQHVEESQLRLKYLEERRRAFQPLWVRAMLENGRAAELQALHQVVDAQKGFELARKVATHVSVDLSTECTRRIAVLYLLDEDGVLGTSDPVQRSKTVEKYAAEISNPQGIRYLAYASLLRDDHLHAQELFEQALGHRNLEAAQRQMLLADLSICVAESGNPTGALQIIEQALHTQGTNIDFCLKNKVWIHILAGQGRDAVATWEILVQICRKEPEDSFDQILKAQAFAQLWAMPGLPPEERDRTADTVLTSFLSAFHQPPPAPVISTSASIEPLMVQARKMARGLSGLRELREEVLRPPLEEALARRRKT